MSKREKRLNRLFTTAKVVLMIYPFMTLIYLSVSAARGGVDIMGAVKSSPTMTIAFLTAMVQPFVACILGSIHKGFDPENSDTTVINLLLLLAAEAMMRNVLGMAGLGVLFYQVVRNSDFSLKRCFTQNAAGSIVKAISGSLAIIPVAGLCLFAIVQIG